MPLTARVSAAPQWMRSCRFIHMQFHEQREWSTLFNGKKLVYPVSHMLYLISSNLVHDDAMNSITVLRFNEHVGGGWTNLFLVEVRDPMPQL